MNSVSASEISEFKKAKLKARSTDINEGLYNAIVAMDAYKDAFYDNPNGFIEYVSERSSELNIMNLFGLMSSFGSSGMELWIKQLQKKHKQKDTNTVLSKETYTIDQLGLLLLKSRSAINAYFKLPKPLVKVMSNSKPVIKRVDLIAFLNDNPSIKILNPTMDKDKMKDKSSKKIVAKRNLR